MRIVECTQPRGRWLATIASTAFVGGAAYVLLCYPSYGWGLFVCAPVALGFLIAALRYVPGSTNADTMMAFAGKASLLMLFILYGAVLALGAEGLICLVMATPLVYMAMVAGIGLGVLVMEMI